MADSINLAEEFPVHVLPEIFQQTIYHIQGETQAPLALIASSVLGFASLASQGVYDVQPSENLRFPTSENFIVLAESGDRKSSTMQPLKASINELQRELDQEFDKSQKSYQSDFGVWKLKSDALGKALAKAIASGADADELENAWRECQEQKPIAPTHNRLLLSDTTSAAIKLELSKGSPSLAVISDEAGTLLTGDLFKDTAINSMWSGHSISVERASSAGLKLENYRLVLMLMLQPWLFTSYLERNGEHARSSGFLARCLICAPQSTQGTRFNNEIHRHRNPEALEKYHQRSKELLRGGITRRSRGLERMCLRLTPEAASRWNLNSDHVEGQIGPLGPLKPYRDYASKVMEHATRIAGILEGFSTKDAKLISDQTMYAGIVVAYWFFNEFIRQMNFLDKQAEPSNAELLRVWLQAHIYKNGGNVYKKNFIRKNGPGKLRYKHLLDSALQDLMLRGIVNIFKIGRTTYVQYLGGVGSV